jgi:hypothetical protein
MSKALAIKKQVAHQDKFSIGSLQSLFEGKRVWVKAARDNQDNRAWKKRLARLLGLSLCLICLHCGSIGFYEELRYYNNPSLWLLVNTIQPYMDDWRKS